MTKIMELGGKKYSVILFQIVQKGKENKYTSSADGNYMK